MNRQRGFSLFEVLVTLLVITGGLLAYVAMQRGVFREANLSSGRVAATELALAKMEDLRSFTQLYTTAGQFAYQDIAANAGGSLALANGSLAFPSVTVDNIAFNRSWAVTNYWYTAVNSAPTTTAPAGNPQPSFRLVTVTITWTDQNNVGQTLALPGIIAGVEPQLQGTQFE